MTETPIFDEYSVYYNLLNSGKDYQAECDYVLSLLGSKTSKLNILELGCGTGGHAIRLADMGHRVTGLDLSRGMIRIANEQRQSLSESVRSRLRFSTADIRDYRDGQKYDLVIALFHVLSYQISNDDLRKAFACAAAHLEPGGHFVFDFWHGPGVLRDLPESRTRRLEDERFIVSRKSLPSMVPAQNRVDVHFSIEVANKIDGAKRNFEESHAMRYLFLPEIQLVAGPDFVTRGFFAWMGTHEPDFDDWLAVAVLEACP